jgi:cyclopropane-fatty-acyl-phospholipid synthase
MFIAENPVHREQANGLSCSIHPERPYEWYRLWLGKSMVFSSAYFQTFQEDLDQAQENGLEHVCNKLQLAKGDRFLDLSCNWGSLLMHAAVRGEVTAHGFSQDNEQVATTELKLIQADLTNRCDVQFGDYKDLRKIKTPFSKIARIGLSEHLGPRQLPEYFRSVSEKLRAGGLFLCDFLTGSTPHERCAHFSPSAGVFKWEFLRLSMILDSAEAAGLSIVNVDEMKDHYEETLRLWFLALTKHRHELARLANRKSVRAWELYIACSAESLRAGDISLHQILFRKGLSGPAIKPELSNRWQREGDLYPLPRIPHSLDGTSCADDRW